MTNKTIFTEDIEKGETGEQKFIKNYFELRGMDYKNVSNNPEYQKKDIDFIANNLCYEVKYNYNNDEKIFIEDYTNINEELGPISKGWIYKSQADILAMVSKVDDTILLFNLKEVKQRYESIKDNYIQKKNKVSERGNNKWQSAFRIIPLSEFEGLYLIA